MRKIILFSLLTIFIAGCATPYQKFELFGLGGYQDKKISKDTYHVAYYGNNATSMETINSLLLYRSAQVTLSNGYDYFEVVSGYARLPLSVYGGFRSSQHTIKMYKGKPLKITDNIFIARDVESEFGPHLKKK